MINTFFLLIKEHRHNKIIWEKKHERKKKSVIQLIQQIFTQKPQAINGSIIEPRSNFGDEQSCRAKCSFCVLASL